MALAAPIALVWQGKRNYDIYRKQKFNVGESMVLTATGYNIQPGRVNDPKVVLSNALATYTPACAIEGARQLTFAPKGLIGSGIGFKLMTRIRGG